MNITEDRLKKFYQDIALRAKNNYGVWDSQWKAENFIDAATSEVAEELANELFHDYRISEEYKELLKEMTETAEAIKLVSDKAEKANQ